MGSPKEKCDDLKWLRRYCRRSQSESDLKEMQGLVEHQEQQHQLQRTLDRSIDAHARTLRRAVSDARAYYTGASIAMYVALGNAAAEFCIITEDAPQDGDPDLLQTILSIGSAVAPELLGFKEALKKLNEAKVLFVSKQMKADHTGVELGTLGDSGKKMYQLVTSVKKPNESKTFRVTAVRKTYALLDKAFLYWLKGLQDLDASIDKYNSTQDANLLPQIGSRVAEFTVPPDLREFDTVFYTDLFLWDMLNAYSRQYVVVEYDAPLYMTASVTIDSPLLNKAIGVSVSGMDQRAVAYKLLGLEGPNCSRLIRSGRPPVSDFRDLVKVWGASFQRKRSLPDRALDALVAPAWPAGPPRH